MTCSWCGADVYITDGGLWVAGPAESDDICVLELDGTT